MFRARIGIITTPNRARNFSSCLTEYEVLPSTEWYTDPCVDIRSVLEEWRDARIAAAVIDEGTLVFSPDSLDELAQWCLEPSSPPFPIVFIGLEDDMLDPRMQRTIKEIAYGGIVHPSREPSVWQAVGKRLDAIVSTEVTATHNLDSRIGSMLEEGICQQEDSIVAQKEDRAMFINRKKHAQDVEKEIFESLGGNNGRAERAASEDFFASTPTPPYPQSNGIENAAGARAVHSGGETDARPSFRIDTRAEKTMPPLFDAEGSIVNAPKGADDAPMRPAHPSRPLEEKEPLHQHPESFSPRQASSNGAKRASDERDALSGAEVQVSVPNTGEVLEKLDELLDQFKLLERIERSGSSTIGAESRPGAEIPFSSAGSSEAEPDRRQRHESDEGTTFSRPTEPFYDKTAHIDSHKSRSAKENNLEYPEGNCLISIAGLPNNCSQVHLGMAASLWLASLGYKTCFVFSDKMQFTSMRAALDVSDLTNGSYRFERCDFYYWSKESSYIGLYDYVIIDCGTLMFSNHSKSYMKEQFCKADVSIMCASGAPWNVYLIAETLKMIQAKELIRWRWFFTDATAGFIREIKPAFDNLKKRLSHTTEFKHLYLLDNTSALDSSDEVPSLEQALYNVLPTGLRNTIRKQNYGNDPERE